MYEYMKSVMKERKIGSGLASWLPKLVVSPTFLIMIVFIYGFIFWNLYLSFSKSKLLPNYEWAGFRAYEILFSLDRWDTASTIYRRIIIPSLRPVFFSVFIILMHIAIKSFDLIIALTSGGPGYASDVPSTFMYTYSFTRGQIAIGSASATMMLLAIVAIIIPYIYSELRGANNEH